MIQDYKILKASKPVKLEEKVKEYVDNGWVTLGGLAIDSSETHVEFFQAMARYQYVYNLSASV